MIGYDHEHVVDVSYGEFAAIGHWCLSVFLGHSIHILYLLSHVSLSLENRIIGVGHHCHRLLFNLIVAVVDHHFPWFIIHVGEESCRRTITIGVASRLACYLPFDPKTPGPHSR